MVEVACIADISMPLRQDQLVLRMLWDMIKHAFGDGLTDSDLPFLDQGWLYTVGGVTYYRGDVWSDNDSVARLVAAFNALRGRTDLIFHDQEHHDRAQQMYDPEPHGEAAEDGCEQKDGEE